MIHSINIDEYRKLFYIDSDFYYLEYTNLKFIYFMNQEGIMKKTIYEPQKMWYIENNRFVYDSYDTKEECETVFNAMLPKNPDLRMQETTSDVALYPYYRSGFNF